MRRREFISLLGGAVAKRKGLASYFTAYRTPCELDPLLATGAAGFPNGEAQKSNFQYPHHSTSRLFLRQTLGLGGEAAFRELWPCT
jgi:hypothetical protein